MDIFGRPAPEPPHALRQHFAVTSHDRQTHTLHSITPMQFGGSHPTDTTRYDPNTVALAEIPPEQATSKAVLYLAPHTPAEPFTNRHWALIGQLVENDLRVDTPIPQQQQPNITSEEVRSTLLDLIDNHGADHVSVIAETSCIPTAIEAISGAAIPLPRTLILLSPDIHDVSPAALQPHGDRTLAKHVHIFYPAKNKAPAELAGWASIRKKDEPTLLLHGGSSSDRLHHLKKNHAGRTARKQIIKILAAKKPDIN